MLFDIFLIIGIPLVLGLSVSHKFPKFAQRFTKFIKYFSILFFSFFVLAALYINFDYFLKYIKHIFFWFLHKIF